MTFLAAILSTFMSAQPVPILHLRADSGVVLDSSGNVSLWKDLSPRKTDFGTLTRNDTVLVATRPAWNKEGMNGLPSLRFGDEKTLVDTTWLPLETGFTAFIVAQDSAPAKMSALLNKSYGDMSLDLWDTTSGFFNMSVSYVSTLAKTHFKTTSPMLYQGIWNGRVGHILAAGRPLAHTMGKLYRNRTTYLCSSYHGSWEGFLRGNVGEVLVYPGVLRDSVRRAIEDSLLKRWDIARLGDTALDRPWYDTAVLVHLRADTGLALDAEGGVKLWKDLGFRGTDFTTRVNSGVTDSASRPQWMPDGMAGRPCVRFGGAHVLVNKSSFPTDSGFTAFLVATDSLPKTKASLFSKGAEDYSVDLWDSASGFFGFNHVGHANLAKSSFRTDEPMLYEAVWDKSIARLLVAGRLEASSAPYSPRYTYRNATASIGATDNSGWQGYLKGRIGEVLILRGVLHDTLRQAIEDELLERWKIDRLGRSSLADISVKTATPTRLDDFRVRRVQDGWLVRDLRATRAGVRTLDGRILFAKAFSSGETRIPAPHGVAILTLVDPDGTTRSKLLPGSR